MSHSTLLDREIENICIKQHDSLVLSLWRKSTFSSQKLIPMSFHLLSFTGMKEIFALQKRLWFCNQSLFVLCKCYTVVSHYRGCGTLKLCSRERQLQANFPKIWFWIGWVWQRKLATRLPQHAFDTNMVQVTLRPGLIVVSLLQNW